jgi:hypothetical protein
VDKLPTSIEIDGQLHEINTDFRNCLKIILVFEDDDLTMQEKQFLMLNLLYKNIPCNLESATKAAIKFLNCGEIFSENIKGNERLYSFNKDSKYIYSGIRQSHNIDLEQIEYLHWWKFALLFIDLREECFFNKIVYLRSQKVKGKLTKEERELYYSLKDIVDLPEKFEEEDEEVIKEFMKKLNAETI